MTREEVIKGLLDLIGDRNDFIDKNDPNCIFRHDKEVLEEAIKLLGGVIEVDESEKAIKCIKIAGYEIKILYDKDILHERNNAGEYSHLQQTIRLATGLTDQFEKEVLIHETLEAIDSIYNLKLNHDAQLNTLSIALHQIFKYSPDFIKYLIGYPNKGWN